MVTAVFVPRVLDVTRVPDMRRVVMMPVAVTMRAVMVMVMVMVVVVVVVMVVVYVMVEVVGALMAMGVAMDARCGMIVVTLGRRPLLGGVYDGVLLGHGGGLGCVDGDETSASSIGERFR
jgi:hypothetical protein